MAPILIAAAIAAFVAPLPFRPQCSVLARPRHVQLPVMDSGADSLPAFLTRLFSTPADQKVTPTAPKKATARRSYKTTAKSAVVKRTKRTIAQKVSPKKTVTQKPVVPLKKAVARKVAPKKASRVAPRKTFPAVDLRFAPPAAPALAKKPAAKSPFARLIAPKKAVPAVDLRFAPAAAPALAKKPAAKRPIAKRLSAPKKVAPARFAPPAAPALAKKPAAKSPFARLSAPKKAVPAVDLRFAPAAAPALTKKPAAKKPVAKRGSAADTSRADRTSGWNPSWRTDGSNSVLLATTTPSTTTPRSARSVTNPARRTPTAASYRGVESELDYRKRISNDPTSRDRTVAASPTQSTERASTRPNALALGAGALVLALAAASKKAAPPQPPPPSPLAKVPMVAAAVGSLGAAGAFLVRSRDDSPSSSTDASTDASTGASTGESTSSLSLDPEGAEAVGVPPPVDDNVVGVVVPTGVESLVAASSEAGSEMVEIAEAISPAAEV